MSEIVNYPSLRGVAEKFREGFTRERKQKDLALLFAHNGTGKTRLSMEFKTLGTVGDQKDTLYYNAFTEDLFSWDNDLEHDTTRVLNLNQDSVFVESLKELEMETRIGPLYQNYVDVNFFIDYDKYTVSFSRTVITNGNSETVENIKISRGEENLFIWCFFIAICELAIDHVNADDDAGAFSWVKYIYVDDPISSLDENNVIAIACNLANLIKREDNDIKMMVSTHHSLFFNVMFNEFNSVKNIERYFLHQRDGQFALQNTKDTPFFHHVAILSELERVKDSGEIYTYHFNALRGVLEKTASFFGYDGIKKCIQKLEESDEVLFNRALNLMSHGKYAVFEPRMMAPDNKELFKKILKAFTDAYEFNLPEIFAAAPTTTTP
jgi:wobble nucleotide-excising tRNase